MENIFVLALWMGCLLFIIKFIGERMLDFYTGYHYPLCLSLVAFGAGGILFLTILPAFLMLLSLVMAGLFAATAFYFLQGYGKYIKQDKQ